MSEAVLLGLLTVLAGGVFQGSFIAPSKWIRGWAWENYWLIFALSAYLICPWALAKYVAPNLFEIYSRLSSTDLLQVLMCGTAWGIGAVTFGLGVEAIGLSLGFAIILGMAATAGTLIPLIKDRPDDFSGEQMVGVGAALLLMLAGVAVCSLAGRWKEQAAKGTQTARPYWSGVLICVISGLLSACGNLGYAFAKELTKEAVRLGTSPTVAVNLVWPLLGLPLCVCNAGYALYLLNKHRTFARYPNSFGRNFPLAVSMGVMWLAGMVFYGAGAQLMGVLGKSLGWAILMSSMVLVANVLGILTGEWKGSPSASRRQLALGILLLVLAIGTLGYANQLQQPTPTTAEAH